MTIYGYGKMHNITFSNVGKLHVFYGENEAGKSTIMSFIHSILFGFPLKTQNENRYEPKDSSAYGGKIVLITKDYGEVTVQRIKGKATGDVTVTYQDGRVGQEDDLKKILQGIDKSTYQSVFSFDLEGLNYLHKLNENEISRYLLSAGLLGSGELLRTEQLLQKESEALFKPSGKNPIINSLLVETKDYYNRLQQAENEQNQYESLQANLLHAEAEKKELDAQLMALEREITISYNYKTVEPLLVEEQRLQRKLNELSSVDVSIDVEERYEQLKQALLPLEAQLSSLVQQREIVEEKQKGIVIDGTFLQEKESIQNVLDETTILETFKQEYENIQHVIREKDNQIQQLRDFVHISLEEEAILQLDTSATMKERVTTLHKASEKLMHDKQYLDERQEHEEQELKALEQRISYLTQHLLEDEQREKLEKQVNAHTNEKQSAMELQFIEQSIRKLEKRIASTNRTERKNQKNIALIFSIIMALLGVGAIISLFWGEYIVGIVIVALFIVIMLAKGKFSAASLLPELQQELEELQHKHKEVQKEQGGFVYGEVDVILQQDYETRQQLQNAQLKKGEHEAAFHKIVDAFEAWEREIILLNEQILDMLEWWRLPRQLTSTEMLVSIYTSMTELKKHIYEKRHLLTRLQNCQEKISSIEASIFHYSAKLDVAGSRSVQEAVVFLRKKLAEVERAFMEHQQLLETIDVFSNQIADYRLQKQHVEKQLIDLYHTTGCEKEEEFVQALAAAKDKKEYEEKLEVLQIQLKPYDSERQKWVESPQIMNEYHIQSLEERKKRSEQRREELMQQIIASKHGIQQLEEGGTYDERSFQYSTKKTELDVEAREWMKYTLAKAMLQKAVNVYKDQKFPKVLQKAQEHLRWITDDEYIRINWDDNDRGLLLQRNDGLVFEAKEVSRGTQEAVYVSLRLALAEQSFTHDGMMIIIDDSFVNFDYHRVQKVIQLLQKIKDTNQIIFFTCHEHLLSLFADNHVTILK